MAIATTNFYVLDCDELSLLFFFTNNFNTPLTSFGAFIQTMVIYPFPPFSLCVVYSKQKQIVHNIKMYLPLCSHKKTTLKTVVFVWIICLKKRRKLCVRKHLVFVFFKEFSKLTSPTATKRLNGFAYVF